MKRILLVAMVAFLFAGLLFSTQGYAQTKNVTFLVNSATVPDTVFAGYSMQIRGSKPPLTWGNDTGGQLINIGGDYWSKTLAFTVGDTIRFKIFAGTDGWESNLVPDPVALGGNDRAYIVANRDTVLPVQFFNSGAHGQPQYFRPWTTVADSFINVYFRVNMHGADQVNRFGYRDSLQGDSVGVRGGGPGPDLNWSPTFYLTKEQPAVNGGFGYAAKWFKSGRLRINKNLVNAGDGIDFKFLIGDDWGRDELQGQPNRHFTIPIGKKDTTISWKNFDNIRPSGRVNTDTVLVTFSTDMSRAIASGGFSIGDTLEVGQLGSFGTGAGAVRTKRLARQGLSNFYQGTDTVVTSRNFVLDYQYYVNKTGVSTRENYYNFYYTGDVSAEGERRQVIVAASGPMTVRDTATSITQARRRPDFPNARTLLRNVLVKWEVDLRPAYYQVLIGHDTLFDIQGTYSITTPAQVFQYGAYINGLATGTWQTWGSTLETDTLRKMYDDGTHGDQIANDSIYTRMILASPDSIGIGHKGQVGQVFKFGIRGGDNEGGRGGFGNNHTENIVDATNSYTLRSQWGSINPAYYNRWDFDNRRPIVTGVREEPGVPVKFELMQNYPNPFNPMTNIGYTIPTQSFVTLKVYNVLGQEVATIVDEMQKPSKYVATFDAKRFASGVYFYRLQAGTFVDTKKFVLLK